MNITQEIFEKHVPAFTNATDEIWLKVQGELETSQSRIENLFGENYESYITKTSTHIKAVCLDAAYHVFHQMDIVLTPTGFGIVRNETLTPASKERTDAVKEEIRRNLSNAIDATLNILLNTDWKSSAQATLLTREILYCPAMFRRYGVKTSEGNEIFREEMEGMKIIIAEASNAIENIISPELYQVLVSKQIDETNMTAPEKIVLEISRQCMASIIMGDHSIIGKRLIQKLERIIEEYANSLTAYKNSQIYKARHTPKYANKKEDPTFFWG